MIKKTLFFLISGGEGTSCCYLLYLSFSVHQTSPSLLTPFKHLTVFKKIYALSLPAVKKKFKMMDLVIYYLFCTCQMWSRRPVFVDERPTPAEGSKSNSCSNWRDCQSKAELTQSQEKPIRSTSRQTEGAGYVCPFNKADRQARKANERVNKRIQGHIKLLQLVWISK